MLAANAPWWMGENGNLPHSQGDKRPAYQNGQASGANAGNYQPQKSFDMYRGQGNQQNYTAAGSPKSAGGYSAYSPQSYSPSQAQPIPPKNTGTAYGQQPTYDSVPQFPILLAPGSSGPNPQPDPYRWHSASNDPKYQWADANDPKYQWADANDPKYQWPGSQPAAQPAPLPSGWAYNTAPGGAVTYGEQSDASGSAYAPRRHRQRPFAGRHQGYGGSMSDQTGDGQRDAFVQQANEPTPQRYTGQAQGALTFDFQDPNFIRQLIAAINSMPAGDVAQLRALTYAVGGQA